VLTTAAIRARDLSRWAARPSLGHRVRMDEGQRSVSVFGSGDEVKAVVTAVESQWRSCASNGVVQGSGEDSCTFDFSAVQFRGDVVTLSMAER
jgi:hypothetical protein